MSIMTNGTSPYSHLGTALNNPNTGTLVGSNSGPFTVPGTYPRINVEARVALASNALSALISKTESYLLTNAELAEKAWLITDEMVAAALKRGAYL